MLGVFDMVVLIVALVTVGEVIKAVLKRRSIREPAPELQAQLKQLEARVQALESVVSDHGYELKRELARL